MMAISPGRERGRARDAPRARDHRRERAPGYAVTVFGLIVYVAVVAGFLVLLDLT